MKAPDLMRLCLFVVGYLTASLPAQAFEPELPLGARLTAERNTGPDSFQAPLAPFADGALPTVSMEGTISRRAWRIGTPGLTLLQVMQPLREQITEAGYTLVFECEDTDCGGYDFRFATEVLPGPNMYVNLSQFRYLTAVIGPEEAPERVISVMVSVAAASAYVQVIHADTGVPIDDLLPREEPAPISRDAIPGAVVPAADLPGVDEDMLLVQGFVVLRDLEFAFGTTDLGPGPFSSLENLARLMRDRPDLRVALVGHTDTVGGLDPNIAVSRARAQAVRQRLIDDYSVSPDRLDAEGMGYLAPVASNLTDEGRSLNRRVEAILLNSQ